MFKQIVSKVSGMVEHVSFVVEKVRALELRRVGRNFTAKQKMEIGYYQSLLHGVLAEDITEDMKKLDRYAKRYGIRVRYASGPIWASFSIPDLNFVRIHFKRSTNKYAILATMAHEIGHCLVGLKEDSLVRAVSGSFGFSTKKSRLDEVLAWECAFRVLRCAGVKINRLVFNVIKKTGLKSYGVEV